MAVSAARTHRPRTKHWRSRRPLRTPEISPFHDAHTCRAYPRISTAETHIERRFAARRCAYGARLGRSRLCSCCNASIWPLPASSCEASVMPSVMRARRAGSIGGLLAVAHDCPQRGEAATMRHSGASAVCANVPSRYGKRRAATANAADARRLSAASPRNLRLRPTGRYAVANGAFPTSDATRWRTAVQAPHLRASAHAMPVPRSKWNRHEQARERYVVPRRSSRGPP